ncbi:GntR family transcriptional regulator [Microbacterium ulmi]|uniref:GntR family transcriptional regulator n=1 Tax=Microbacterium ulmi TaxID=179095 RepID=A0A7Y2Q1R4_9MICO|nr:GntR family transcriptional regulator [Microbacterium ulmi]NNH03943.1 GntR family transcriptional regulator [Microbacterium ulmi]
MTSRLPAAAASGRDRPNAVGPPRFRRLANEIEARITDGRYPVDTALPSETALAREFGVARSTVRQALEELESERMLLSQRGARWYAHEPTRPQSLSVLRSFGQWALAAGLEPTGRTVRLSRGRATSLEARELGLHRLDPVLRIVRVRALGERPVMVKRTTFPEWLAAIIEELPLDVRSIMEVVEDKHGVWLAHAEHRIQAVSAGSLDSRLLRLPRTAPLLQVIRTARAADGRAFEYSDDRYVASAVAFSVVNTAGGHTMRDGDAVRHRL